MAYTPYNYGGYPTPNYYTPPMPDQLAQLRQNQYQNPMMNQQPMQQQMQQQAPVQQPTQPMQPALMAQQSTMSGPVFVNGEAGARGFMVGAGNTVMLIDADPDAHTFWLKSADASGMPSIRTFDYTERVNAPRSPQTPVESAPVVNADYVTREEWNALQARADALAKELEELKAKKAPAPKKTVKEADE